MAASTCPLGPIVLRSFDNSWESLVSNQGRGGGRERVEKTYIPSTRPGRDQANYQPSAPRETNEQRPAPPPAKED
jgi:hypothetical protein